MLAEGVLATAPEATRRAREPLRWSVPRLKKEWGVSSVVPDGMAGLRFRDETAAYFLLELDRGGLPIVRRSASDEQTSFARKIAFYWNGWRRGSAMNSVVLMRSGF
jgi:hypothetical protein